jgi:hypothetical protein
VRERQQWAIDQERMRHNQALFTIGEYAMFALMWHLEDYNSGLVDRCSRCYGSSGSTTRVIAEAYAQPTQNRCPICFGTTFEGGYKNLLVRPAIFSDNDESEALQARGIVNPTNLSVESTVDFRVRSGDYVFRSSGDRFRLSVPERVTLRTGFSHPRQSDAAIGYNHAQAKYESPTASVAYDIGPSAGQLRTILEQVSRFPETFEGFEDIRGPLIPAGD